MSRTPKSFISHLWGVRDPRLRTTALKWESKITVFYKGQRDTGDKSIMLLSLFFYLYLELLKGQN